MDVAGIIDLCQKTGLRGVELRTTHAHKVEVDLTARQRNDVKKQFEDGGIEIVGLGSTFGFHATDADVVRENVEGTI